MDQFRKDILKEDEEQHKKKVENIGQSKGYKPDKDNKDKGSKWELCDIYNKFEIMFAAGFPN